MTFFPSIIVVIQGVTLQSCCKGSHFFIGLSTNSTLCGFPVSRQLLNMMHVHCQSPEVQFVPELANFSKPFSFFVEMTMPHGVVIKCASRGVLSGSGPLDLTIK